MDALPPTVLSWSRGLASLSPGVVPCRGLREPEWRETHQRCTAFVDWCERAIQGARHAPS